MFHYKIKNFRRGVAALITVLSIGGLIFTISLTSAIIAFWANQNIKSIRDSNKAFYAAQSGLQDALIKLERNKDYFTTYSTFKLSVNGTDDVTVSGSYGSNQATITSTSILSQINKKLQTVVDINATSSLITPTSTTELVMFTCGESVTFTYKGSSVTYGTVVSQGKCWLDRNLGASQVATAFNDSAAYGDLFQWGRLDDGHQTRTSGTTTTLSSTDNPGHSNFILAPNSPYDWRSPQNNNLWQGVSGINNPCPSGWRIPTSAEWDTERATWGTQNYNGAYASPLKLTAGGDRCSVDGVLGEVGFYGEYWSSTVQGTDAKFLQYNIDFATIYYYDRAFGYTVRCLKD
jgi:uncharacterized protein (TIGR02145 family)